MSTALGSSWTDPDAESTLVHKEPLSNSMQRVHPSIDELSPSERERERDLTAWRQRVRSVYVSSYGLTRCGGCGRHIDASELDQTGACRFCGREPDSVMRMRRIGSPRVELSTLPQPTRALAEALQARTPQRAPHVGPINDHFSGQMVDILRVPRADEVSNPHPTLAVWELTLACDLHCQHCGSRAKEARPRELTTPEALDVVRQLADVGIRELTIIGGEAYLYPGWLEVIREASRLGIVVGMQTGARQLTQDRINRAADAGLSLIGISIDGLQSTHDVQRGYRGSWRAAVDAAERVARTSLRLSVNSQINRLSLPELPAIARLLVDIGAKAWQTQLTVAMGNAVEHTELLLQPYDLATLFPLLAWIKEVRLDPGGVQLVPGNNIGYFGPYEEILRYGGSTGVHWSGCAAGATGIGLEADGKVKGCPSLASDDFTGGNVRQQSIAEIVSQAPEVTHLKHRTRSDLWGRCAQCYYASTCLGGCTWTAHSLTGRPGNNPYCIHRVLELQAQGLRERIERIAAAPGRPFDRGTFRIVEECLLPPLDNPSILGLSIDTVLQLSPESPGIWARKDLLERIRKS